MEIQTELSYQVVRDGQQFGPYDGQQIIEMAKAGELLASDTLWAEGLPNWTTAASFTQLAAIFAPAATPEPAGTPATPMSSNNDAPVNDAGIGQNPISAATNSSGIPADGPGTPAGVRLGRVVERKGAKFGAVVFSYFLAIFGLIGFIYGGVKGLSSLSTLEMNEDGTFPVEAFMQGDLMIAGISYVVLMVGYLLCLIFTLVYLYRAWKYIQDLPNVSTTPGKAVGLLFLPFFNLYWIFRAFHGWATDYNLRCDIADPVNSEQANEGLFMMFCILTLVTGLSIFIYLPVMRKICRSVNYLASSPELEVDPNAGYSL